MLWSTWNIDPPEGLRFPLASPPSSTFISAIVARDKSRLHTQDEELKQSGSIELVEVRSHVQRTATGRPILPSNLLSKNTMLDSLPGNIFISRRRTGC